MAAGAERTRVPAILGANHLDLVDDGHVPASRERDHLDRATRVRREGQLVALLPAPQRDGIDSRLVFHTRISVVSFVFLRFGHTSDRVLKSRGPRRASFELSARPRPGASCPLSEFLQYGIPYIDTVVGRWLLPREERAVDAVLVQPLVDLQRLLVLFSRRAIVCAREIEINSRSL